jgi:cytochrome b
MTHQKILVWDLPVRAFHWLLAISFAGAFLTAESERLRDVHVAFGYTMLGLVAFRLLWGVLGTRYARFSAFAFGPRRVIKYLKSLITFKPQRYVGHNPAGSWAIYALFALSLLAGVTGYATFNDIGGDWLQELHEGAANTLLAFVIVHIAGVLVTSIMHRENLVRSMLSGYKSGGPHEAIRHKHRAVAAALLVAVGAFWFGGGTDALPSLNTHAQFTKHDVAQERHD